MDVNVSVKDKNKMEGDTVIEETVAKDPDRIALEEADAIISFIKNLSGIATLSFLKGRKTRKRFLDIVQNLAGFYGKMTECVGSPAVYTVANPKILGYAELGLRNFFLTETKLDTNPKEKFAYGTAVLDIVKEMSETVRSLFKRVEGAAGVISCSVYYGRKKKNFDYDTANYLHRLVDKKVPVVQWKERSGMLEPEITYTVNPLKGVFKGEFCFDGWDISFDDNIIIRYGENGLTRHFLRMNDIKKFYVIRHLNVPLIEVTYGNENNGWQNTKVYTNMRNRFIASDIFRINSVKIVNALCQMIARHGQKVKETDIREDKKFSVVVKNRLKYVLFTAQEKIYLQDNDGVYVCDKNVFKTGLSPENIFAAAIGRIMENELRKNGLTEELVDMDR